MEPENSLQRLREFAVNIFANFVCPVTDFGSYQEPYRLMKSEQLSTMGVIELSLQAVALLFT
jgi:hypothetical protein